MGKEYDPGDQTGQCAGTNVVGDLSPTQTETVVGARVSVVVVLSQMVPVSFPTRDLSSLCLWEE